MPDYFLELSIYSVRKLLTGLAMAAFNAWMLTVNRVTNNIATAVMINMSELMLILYSKSFSHHA